MVKKGLKGSQSTLRRGLENIRKSALKVTLLAENVKSGFLPIPAKMPMSPFLGVLCSTHAPVAPATRACNHSLVCTYLYAPMGVQEEYTIWWLYQHNTT